MMKLSISKCSLEEAYAVSLQIPEFEPWYPWEKWQERCRHRQVIALVALVGDAQAGLKVGYIEGDEFYSWIGGVIPACRGQGVARRLAEVQEEMVRAAGITKIRMKTHNRFVAMLCFALQSGFYIAAVERAGDPQDWKITLYKNL
jgi:GNAT superfamily N-acetyltransferase